MNIGPLSPILMGKEREKNRKGRANSYPWQAACSEVCAGENRSNYHKAQKRLPWRNQWKYNLLTNDHCP